MDKPIAELAEEAGIESGYISESGEHCVISDEVKRALLELMDVHGGDRGQTAGAEGPAKPCFVPDWLQESRAWGISLQLYGVRSERNAGIGDFEDLARLAEMFGSTGADFIGVNPLHALFMADPERASPYSPSSKSFLNPIYIAVDRVIRGTDVPQDDLEALRQSELVGYARVAAIKLALLAQAFALRADDPNFATFREAGGAALHRFAVFETLSEHFAARDRGAGWHGWPAPFKDPDSPDVTAFTNTHAERIEFHKWLQWVAADQLADAQRRSLAAGMRIGIYLDLAVGVSPDGAAAWSDRTLYATGARVGAPPDMFNHLGQDWGLAPMRPTTLSQRRLEPFAAELSASTRASGAIRIDHAMSLARLYWLPSGTDARNGGYVRYPMASLLSVLGRCSQEHSCIMIGEDLGTVPPGFRGKMQAHHILSYRVLYFERGENGIFNSPGSYPKEALACVATHDLPPLRGWWRGSDIDARARCQLYEHESAVGEAHDHRAREREMLLASLQGEGLIDVEAIDLRSEVMPDALIAAVHRYLARSPAWLLAAQLEDLVGAVEMVNLPGTDKQHANWRRKLPIGVEELLRHPTLTHTVESLAAERPRNE